MVGVDGEGVIFLIHINIYKEYEGKVCRNEIDQLTVKTWPILNNGLFTRCYAIIAKCFIWIKL